MSAVVIVALVGMAGTLVTAILSLRGVFKQAQTALAAAGEQTRSATRIAERQIQAQTIVASRQRWIDELRADISKYTGILLRIQHSLERGSGEAHHDWIEQIVEASIAESKIILMLNPYSEVDKRLIKAVQDPLNQLRSGHQINWGTAANRINEQGRIILKEAWDQIKSEAGPGEPPETKSVTLVATS